MGLLLDADIRQILSYIQNGTEIRCVPPTGYDRSYHPRRIRKIGDDLFLDADRNCDYPLACVLNDISNKRISLGQIIGLAEENENFKMDIDGQGKLSVYNTTLEDAPKRRRSMSSDSLIMFRETMPKKLVDAGLADNPAKITAFVYDKICARAANAKRNGHHFDNDTLLKIRDALNDPLAIVSTKTKSGDAALAVLTRVPDFKGLPSLVIIQKDEERGDNWISSVYGKNHVAGYLLKQQKEGNLLYIGDDIQTLMEQMDDKDKKKLKEVIRVHKNPVEPEKKTTLSKINDIVTRERNSLR